MTATEQEFFRAFQTAQEAMEAFQQAAQSAVAAIPDGHRNTTRRAHVARAFHDLVMTAYSLTEPGFSREDLLLFLDGARNSVINAGAADEREPHAK